MKVRLIAAASIAIAMCQSISGLSHSLWAAEEESIMEADSTWQFVESLRAGEASPTTEAEYSDFWGEIGVKASDRFFEMCKTSPNDETFNRYVNRVDMSDTDGALRWILSVSLFMPNNSPNGYKGDVGKYQAGFSRAVVRRASKDQKFFRGYARACLFKGFLGVDQVDKLLMAAGFLRRGMREQQSEIDQARLLQMFVVLAHATDREDLVVGKSFNDLQKAATEWCEWFFANEGFLRRIPDDYRLSLDTEAKRRDDKRPLKPPGFLISPMNGVSLLYPVEFLKVMVLAAN